MGGYRVFPGGAADAAELQGVDLGGPVRRPLRARTMRRVPRSEANAQRAARIAAAARAACRELREEADLTVDPATLRHWAHWITPSGVWRRFDTHFFLAPAPSGQRPRLDEREASEWCWVPPHLHACDVDINPEFPLTAPTQMVLREIAEDVARLGSLEALLASAPARSIRTVIPKMIGMEFVVFPWGPRLPRPFRREQRLAAGS
ncbi:MAG: NUDIX hydrolase [Steroidobacteraceae bacterium]